MKINVNQQDLQKSLNYCQGVIEKRSTLPILSNVLLDASQSKLTITATDLDLIFIHEVKNVEVIEEGKTTTTSSIMYDIIRKFTSGKKINLSLSGESKLQLESEIRIAGNEAAFAFTGEVDTGNGIMTFRPIDVMAFNDDGKVTSMRAFFGPTNSGMKD